MHPPSSSQTADIAPILRDREIREALRHHLLERSPRPTRLIEELGVHNGNAKADLVAVYKEMHCFEIKGATDSIRRMSRQAAYFDEAFPKVTLVTTANHVAWCQRHLPIYWGIMVAKPVGSSVVLHYLRPARNSPRFAKQKALMMLWKAELTDIALQIAKIRVKRSDTREDLALHLSTTLRKDVTLASIQTAIMQRSDAVADVGDMAGKR